MTDIKILRDKLNGSIKHNDDMAELQAQWDEMHRKMKEDRLNDDENFEDFER